MPGITKLNELRNELQLRIGCLPRVDVFHFEISRQNVHKDQDEEDNIPSIRHGVSVLRVQPASLSEIVRAVRAARSMKLCLRCCGRGTSNETALFVDEGDLLMDASQLCDRPKIEIIRQRRVDFTTDKGVRVLAGVTQQQLVDFQVQNQVNLATNVETTSRTVVGSVVSGSHTTATREGSSLADQVIQIRIIDCHGDLRTYMDDGSEVKAKQLRSVVSNLGLMGVVYDVTLKVTPLMNVQVDYDFPSMDWIINSADTLRRRVEDNYSTQIIYTPFNSIQVDRETNFVDLELWDPSQDEVMVRSFNPVGEGIASAERQYVQILTEIGPPYRFLENPEETPIAMKISFDLQRRQFLSSVIQPLPWAIHCFEEIKSPTHDLCFTINTGKNFEQLSKLMKLITERIKVNAVQNRYPVNLCVRVSFTGPTSMGLCPGIGDQPGQVAHVSLQGLVSDDDVEVADRWAAEIGRLLMAEFPDCSPQWTAAWANIKDVNDRLRDIYAAAISEFKVHLEDVDRDGMFMNSHLKKLFYPSHIEDYRSIYLKERKAFIAA